MIRFIFLGILLVFSGVAKGLQEEDMSALGEALTTSKASLDELIFDKNGESKITKVNLGSSVVNFKGDVFDGLRFTAPKSAEGKDFIWYFNAPENWGHWYILPIGDEPKQGFRKWINADRMYQSFDNTGEKCRLRVLQTLDGEYFETGKEYALWFRRLDDAVAGEIRVKASFAKREKEDWDAVMLEKYLELEPQPAEAQVVALRSEGGKILLDEKFFDRTYAKDRIDSVFFSIRRQTNMAGGFFIQIQTSTPPCKTTPKISEIIAKYGAPDFIRTSEEEAERAGTEEDEENTITHYYDYFGFVVEAEDKEGIITQVTAQANDFSSLRPKERSRATFGVLRHENLTAFHFDGDEVGRIYQFDEEAKVPCVMKYPPKGVYLNEDTRLTFLGDGKWIMEGLTAEGEVSYIKRFTENRLNGITEVFHLGGKTKMLLSYKDGLADGKCTEFDKAGKILREAMFRKGAFVEE